MAARIDSRKRKAIVADYVLTGDYKATARKMGVSATSVKNIVLADKEFALKCAKKNEEDIKDILDYLDKRKLKICNALDLLLEAMQDKTKIEKAFLKDIATAFGVIFDKATSAMKLRDEMNKSGGNDIKITIERKTEDLSEADNAGNQV